MQAGKLGRLLGWSVLAVVALVAMLLALLHVPAVQRAILARILAIEGPVRVSVEHFEFNLFRRTAEARDVTIRAGAGDPAFLFAREMRISWSYRALRRGLAGLALRGSGLTLDLARLPDGRLNLPETGEGGDPLAPPAIVELDDIRLLYSDHAVSACLGPLRLTIRDGRLDLAQQESGTVDAAGFNAAIEAFTAGGTIRTLSLEGAELAGNVAIRTGPLPQVGALFVTSAVVLNGPGQRLRLENLRASGRPYTAGGTIDLALDDGISNGTLTASGDGFNARAALTWPGFEAEKATGSATITAARADVRGTATVQIDPRFISASTRSIEAFGATAYGAVRMDRNSLALSGVVNGVYPVAEGSVELRANVGGTAKAPRAALEARSNDLAAGDFTGVRLWAVADANMDRVHVEKAVAIWQGQTVTATGDVLLNQNPIAVDFSIVSDGLRLAPLIDAAGLDVAADGNVQLSASLTGAATDPQVNAFVEASELIAYGEKLGSLWADVTYRNSFVEITAAELNKPQDDGIGTLSFDGWTDLEDEVFAVKARSTGLQLESLQFGGSPAIRGELELDAKLSGPLDDPNGYANARIHGNTLGEIRASAKFDNRSVSAEVQAPRVILDPLGIPGEISFTASGSAPWGEWDKVDASANVSKIEFMAGAHRVSNEEPIEIGIREGNLEARRVHLASDGADFHISGAIGLLSERASGLELHGDLPLELAKYYIPEAYPVDISGLATIDGSIRGYLGNPDPDVTILAENVCVALPDVPTQISPVSARVRVRRDFAEIEQLEATFSGGTINGSGRVAYEEGNPSNARISIRGVDLKPLLGESIPKTFRLPLTATIEAETNGWELGDVSARAVIEDLAIIAPQGELRQTGPAVLTLNDETLTLDGYEARGDLSRVAVSGSLNIPEQTINAKLEGNLDLGLAARASPDFAISGTAAAGVVVRGTIEQPVITGGLTWKDGRFALNDPLVGGDEIDLTAHVQGNKVVIENFAGVINGGRARMNGSFLVRGGRPENVDLSLTARNLFLDYPRGLHTVSGGRLTLKSSGRNFLLGGQITLQDGSYREGFDLATLLRNARRAPPSMLKERNELLESLRFDVAIRTEQPLVVDNNLGRVSTGANLRLIGSPQRPGLTGRLEVEENSRIYFGGRTFEIREGYIDFTEENRIWPVFNLAAETRVSSYDITMRLLGDLETLETSFSAEPTADQDQIMALLFTGSIDNAHRGAAYAQTQMLTLFGSSLTGGISTRLRNTIGLSEFRIDPGLISPDSDPTARLTLAQDLTPEFRVTYSTNLANSQDQIWAVEYNWRRTFQARYFRQSDQSNRVEFRKRFRFGGGPHTGDFSARYSRPNDRVGTIKIEGKPVLDEKTILGKLRLKPGGKYDAIRAQDGVRRLREHYARLGFAEVRIQQDRDVEGGTPRRRGASASRRQVEGFGPVGRYQRDPRVYNLTYTIDSGQPVRFVFEGAAVSQRHQNRIANLWQQGLIDQQRIRTASLELRNYFVQKGYADTVVEAEIKTGEDIKTIVFEIDRGVQFDRPEFVFQGVPDRLADELQTALRRERLDRELRTRPAEISTFLERFLAQQGFLSARVESPSIEVVSEKKLVATVAVETGPEYLFGDIKFRGVSSLDDATIRRAMIVEPGDKFIPDDHYSIAGRVQRAYWNAGFRKAEVDLEESLRPETGRVDITVIVDEKQKLIVENVEIEGLDSTSEAFVRRRLLVEEGDVLNAAKVNQSRRNMVDTGAYNIIDFTYPPFGPITAAPEPQPVTLNIGVREPKPYRLDLGGTYDTERGPGIITDISTINKLGEARVLGFRTLVDGKRQEYRGYFTQPFLGSRRINTTSTLFYRKELDLGAFDTENRGFTIQQFIRFGPRFDLIYGIRWEQASATVRETGDFLDSTTVPINLALVRDSRDNVLDATRGSFLSSSYEYAPGMFETNLRYYRFFVQGFKYFGLTKPARMPFEGEQRRSRVVYATGMRYGVASTSEDDILLPVNRFFGGGGTTVRGYANNSLGPSLLGESVGGMGTLVINNEIRFPVWNFIDAVAFFDAGNVWEFASQVAFNDLRAGTGFGIRIRNPFIVLRFDYGWKVGRRPGESAGAFFFSIGQAF